MGSPVFYLSLRPGLKRLWSKWDGVGGVGGGGDGGDGGGGGKGVQPFTYMDDVNLGLTGCRKPGASSTESVSLPTPSDRGKTSERARLFIQGFCAR